MFLSLNGSVGRFNLMADEEDVREQEKLTLPAIVRRAHEQLAENIVARACEKTTTENETQRARWFYS